MSGHDLRGCGCCLASVSRHLTLISPSVNMCNIAAQRESSWLMVDPWEAFQSYQRTAVVLDHFDHEINTRLGGVYTQDGERRNVRVMLLAGSDLIATMSQPGVWSEADVRPRAPLLYYQTDTVRSWTTSLGGTAPSLSSARARISTRR